MSISKSQLGATTTTTQPNGGSRNHRVAAHYKKWWWAHTGILIAMVLIVVLPIIYIGYPRLVQKEVSASSLHITEMRISNPSPSSFTLHQTQVIGSHSSFHPQIDSFEASVSLLGAAVPFSRVQVSAVKTSDGAVVEIDQVLELGNGSAFGEFARAFMMSDVVELEISGKPSLKQGGLPRIQVEYDKVVSMKGLNTLEGFNVTEFHIVLEEVNGRNMNGTILIPNPSVMTVDMGNITLNLAVAGQVLGYSYIDNLTLKPGENVVPMTSSVNRSAVLELVYSEDSPYQDGVVPFQITGNSSRYHGEELPYFIEALRANNLTVGLNVSRAVSEIMM